MVENVAQGVGGAEGERRWPNLDNRSILGVERLNRRGTLSYGTVSIVDTGTNKECKITFNVKSCHPEICGLRQKWPWERRSSGHEEEIGSVAYEQKGEQL